ncbi:lytic transglycosylase domain-containing protein [Propionicicella superfundia]|uniref:lytic transglycosylase domain-containing protein n=1 Tax=Propionicicella superfundia TaxID=348582 RepID=UPI00040A9C75|nr:lytic murein transglycosylase [Propionicicella superfundia]
MTEPIPPARHRDRDDGTVVLPDPVAAESASPRTGTRRLLPVTTVTLAVLGAAALLAGTIGAAGGASVPAPSVPAVSATAGGVARTPSAASAAAVDAGAASGRQDTPISELADPAWVSRIAEQGDIPERALAAYAGASLAVAGAVPGCRIGWNTLAAIGKVESEHGTMNGARIDDRGVASPTIIGIALDGSQNTARIPDTDDGRLDQDTAWDRAVGPMQFIPATWAQAARDGNKDGAKDINQIDDAALSAAVLLCEAGGGDLTVAEGWIAAVAAYNDSADYNNRVAEAATTYATLR